jgi:hypothetical protein
MRIIDERGAEVPVEVGAFVLEEARVYRVVPTRGVEVRACRLGPESLPRLPGGDFALTFGHSVGITELAFEHPGGTARHRVEVRPRIEKLDGEAWNALVDDLVGWLPGVLLGLSQASGGSVGDEGAVAALTAAAVLPWVDDFVAAVEAVVRDPKTDDTRRDDDRRMHAIRRPVPPTLRWMGRNPSAKLALSDALTESGAGDPWIPTQVPDDTLDHPANRAVRWYIEQVARRFTAVAAQLTRAVTRAMDEVKQWGASLAERLAQAASRLHAVVRGTFLARVTAQPPGPTALLTLADVPHYARVLRLARRILNARFRPDTLADAPPAPLRASFELYELWCLLAVQRALDAALPAAQWHPAPIDDDRLLAADLFEFSLQRPLDGGTLALSYNPTFHSYLTSPKHDRLALTGQRRPDLTVSWQSARGDVAWVVLDAKYRVSREALGDAFTSLHIYRDALRWRSQGGSARAGLLLVPEVWDDVRPWAAPHFRQEHGMGLWRLRPGAPVEGALGRWILDTLGAEVGS